jgi:serine/threonine protein kinase
MTKSEFHTENNPFPPSKRYKIERLLGMGGMGEVYLAWDPQLQRNVALKYLKKKLCNEMRIRTRFIREARALAKVSHPRVVKVYEVIDNEDVTFFVQECLQGRDLEWVVDERALLDSEEMKKILIELAEALSVLHENGLVHRDLKPSNLFIDDERGLCLLDFGLVLDEEKTRLTQDNTIVGTLNYMSPEMVNGDDVTSCSDIYQVGLITHVLVTGHNLDRPSICDWGDLIPVASMNVSTPAPSSDCPKELRDVIIKCCKKKPQERIQNGAELLEYLTKKKTSKRKKQPKTPPIEIEDKLDDSVGTGPVSISNVTKPVSKRQMGFSALVASFLLLLFLYVIFRSDSSPCSISAMKITATPDGALVTYVSGRAIQSRVEIARKNKDEWLEYSSADKSFITSHEIMIKSLIENSDYRLRVILPNDQRSLTQSFKTDKLKLKDFMILKKDKLRAQWQLSHGQRSSLSLGEKDELPAVKSGKWWQVDLPKHALKKPEMYVQTTAITGSTYRIPLSQWYTQVHKTFFERAPLGTFRLSDAVEVFGRGLEDDVAATIDKQTRLRALRKKFKEFVDEKKLLQSYDILHAHLPFIFETHIVSLRHKQRVYECLIEFVRLFTYADDFRFNDLVKPPKWPYLKDFAIELMPTRQDWQLQTIHKDNERTIRLGKMMVAGPLTKWTKRFSLGKGFKAREFAIEFRTDTYRDRILQMKLNGHKFYIFHEPILPYTNVRPLHFRQHIPRQCLMKSVNTMELTVEGPYAGREDSSLVNIYSVSLAFR